MSDPSTAPDSTSTTDADATGVAVGDIRFYRAIIPPLEDGDYLLTATQTLSGLPGEPDPSIPQQTLAFSVRGPRFRLNPADIHSSFPPPSPTVPYEGQIPHVVVSRKTLPWERVLGSHLKGVPWVALLSINADDPGGIPTPTSGTVHDLLQPGDGTLGPAIHLDDGEQPTDPVTYVDVPIDLFTQIAPTLHDLAYLAHAREVNTGNKPIEGIIADGVYSVIVGNRVTHPTDLTGAFLVSVEGYVDLLTPGSDGALAVPAGITTVRLAVLTSWTFQMGAVDPFDALMRAVKTGLLAVSPPPVAAERPESGTCTVDSVTVPSPPTDPTDPDFIAATVAYALQSGYAALPHALRDGSATFSWYRGPLVPFDLPLTLNPDTTWPTFSSADELVRYDPDTGLFDITYAAAFELGRLLALQNEGFLTALRTYLHQVKGQAMRLASRGALVARQGDLRLPHDPAALTASGSVLDAAAHWVATTGADALHTIVGRAPNRGTD